MAEIYLHHTQNVVDTIKQPDMTGLSTGSSTFRFDTMHEYTLWETTMISTKVTHGLEQGLRSLRDPLLPIKLPMGWSGIIP